MRELKFNVFGKLIGIVATESGWAAFHLGSEGKRRSAELVIPTFVLEEELCQYLADIFHESATPTNGEVKRVE
jgi:hypothetical protein